MAAIGVGGLSNIEDSLILNSDLDSSALATIDHELADSVAVPEPQSLIYDS